MVLHTSFLQVLLRRPLFLPRQTGQFDDGPVFDGVAVSHFSSVWLETVETLQIGWRKIETKIWGSSIVNYREKELSIMGFYHRSTKNLEYLACHCSYEHIKIFIIL